MSEHYYIKEQYIACPSISHKKINAYNGNPPINNGS